MYKRIFKGSYIPDTVEPTEEDIRKSVLESYSISFMDFDNKEDSEEFVKNSLNM